MAGKLARDGDGDDRAPLTAALERVPALMQTAGTLVGAGADWGRLPLPPSLERRARAQRAALVPGRLDEQAPGVRVAGLRDRALAAALTRGVLARDEPQEGAETLRSEALPLAELDARGECGQGGDSAQTAKPAADLAEGRLAGELDDRLIERVPAPFAWATAP